MLRVRCINNGCQQDFDPQSNNNKACLYHSGKPVFHEGWKYWSCCEQKRHTSFNDFMMVVGCERGVHRMADLEKVKQTTNDSKPMATVQENLNAPSYAGPKKAVTKKVYIHYERAIPHFTYGCILKDNATIDTLCTEFVEAYNARHGPVHLLDRASTHLESKRHKPYKVTSRAQSLFNHGDDVYCIDQSDNNDTALPVMIGGDEPQISPAGTNEMEGNGKTETPVTMTDKELNQSRVCERCKSEFTERNNPPNGCKFHPGVPLFHEGAKGWSCCRRTVWDFDDFLTLEPCTSGSHTDIPCEKGDYARKGGQLYTWDQDQATVTVWIGVVGIKPDDCIVDFQSENVCVSIKRGKLT
eukprot:Ihof_evm4s44 gene=Ihof_evmTU4s44